MTTTKDDPDQIRREIERTRQNLSSDVEALTEKVNPSRVVERKYIASAAQWHERRTRSWAAPRTRP